MADPPSYRDSADDTGPPRWVYAFGIIGILLILLFAVLHFAGGGLVGHTPPSP